MIRGSQHSLWLEHDLIVQQTTQTDRNLTASTNIQKHSYFYILPQLWNPLPTIDPDLPLPSIKRFVISHFVSNFEKSNPCTQSILYALAILAHLQQ